MYIKDLKDCEEFITGDETKLRELLHPDKSDLKLRYSLAHAIVEQGKTSTAHKLKTSEVYYILEGEGVMHIGDESEKVSAGQAIYIPPNTKQYIENTGDSPLNFYALLILHGKKKMRKFYENSDKKSQTSRQRSNF